MRSVAALSGWGQPKDALASAVPQARFIDYAPCRTIDEAFALLPHKAEAIIGWSLGGQIAVRAVAEKRIAPRFLVLIATPFQFVASDEDPLGMGRVTFAQFHENLARDPRRTFKKSYALIAHGDAREDTVAGYLSKQQVPADSGHWGRWLDMLSAYSCSDLDFAHFPPTLLIHGEQDAVVGAAHSHEFQRRLPRVESLFIPGCGHAPHWHDAGLVGSRIAEFLR